MSAVAKLHSTFAEDARHSKALDAVGNLARSTCDVQRGAHETCQGARARLSVRLGEVMMNSPKRYLAL